MKATLLQIDMLTQHLTDSATTIARFQRSVTVPKTPVRGREQLETTGSRTDQPLTA